MELQIVLNQEFWQNLLNNLLNWLINEGPSFILIIILLFVSLKFLNIVIRRLKQIFAHRAAKSDETSLIETEKRMNTLLGILKGLGRIIIWSVFIMIFLKKFGIGIGPILAVAGILGLAVGFGHRNWCATLFPVFSSYWRTRYAREMLTT